MEEVCTVLKGMSSFKALGPDGFQAVFFKKTWELTGKAVYSFVQNILEGDEIPSEAAKAMLVLIPKEGKAMLHEKIQTDKLV